MFPLIHGIVNQGGASLLLNDLIAYWKMDEDSGSRLDAVNDYDFVANGTITAVQGVIGNAALLEKTNSEYFSVADPLAELGPGSGSWTMAGWIKLTDPSLFNACIFRKLTGAGAAEIQLLTNNEVVTFYTYTSAIASAGSVASSVNLPVDAWAFLAIRVNAGDGTIAIHVEGTTNSTPLTGTLTASTAPLYAGSNNGASAFMNCELDEWGIWKRYLSDDELADLRNDGWGLSYPFLSDAPPSLPTAFVKVETSSYYDAFGQLLVDGQGDPLVIARRGATHIDATGAIVQWRGTGWSSSTIYDSASDDRNVGGGLASTGTLIMFVARREATPPWDGVVPLRSIDDGVTWTPQTVIPVTAPDEILNTHGPLVELPSGKLMKTFNARDEPATYNRTLVMFSSDDGVTWGDEVQITTSGSTINETAAIYIDGETDEASRLLAVSRTASAVEFFKSGDGGATWASMGTLDIASEGVSPWLYKRNGWLIFSYTRRNTSPLTITYRVARAVNAFDSILWWSDGIEIYESSAANSADFGYATIIEYRNALHVSFYDDTEADGLPNLLTSIIG